MPTALPELPVTNPTTLTPSAPLVFDQWGIVDFHLMPRNPSDANSHHDARVMVRQYATLPDGSKQYSNTPATLVQLHDVEAKIAGGTYTSLLACQVAIMQAVLEVMTKQGKL